MKEQTVPPPVVHNTQLLRFEIQQSGQLAWLHYFREVDTVVFDHTFVPEELRGRGMAGALARAALAEARRQRWRVVPRCPFVADFLKRNAEYADMRNHPV